jgi:hypothetical protein
VIITFRSTGSGAFWRVADAPPRTSRPDSIFLPAIPPDITHARLVTCKTLASTSHAHRRGPAPPRPVVFVLCKDCRKSLLRTCLCPASLACQHTPLRDTLSECRPKHLVAKFTKGSPALRSPPGLNAPHPHSTFKSASPNLCKLKPCSCVGLLDAF